MPASHKVVWTDKMLARPTAEILAFYGRRDISLTRAAVSAARRARGIPTPEGHGGKRRGAGRTPRKKHTPKD